MPGQRKLIVVSNRGPVSYGHYEAGERTVRRGGGGLVTALRSLASHHDVTWVASAMSDEDRIVAEESGGAFEETAPDGSRFRLRLVAHEPEAYELFYDVIANPTLWFVQHHLWPLSQAPDVGWDLHAAWHEGYAVVNLALAEAAVEELERIPDAALFLHDYHLYLMPRLVRERAPGAALSHFVHVPWPESDAWYVLPEAIRVDIHASMLANDVVGLHTERWRRNFLRSCADLLGAEVDHASGTVDYDGRRTLVTAHPISVDPGEFDELARSDRVLAEERALEASRPEKLIVRVDRTDPAKNIPRGFRAFALYLESRPELHGRVTMLALLDPSRQEIPEYAEHLAEIRREADAVNQRFGRAGWMPVDLRISDDFPASVAAYKQFDVLLVNAIFDGLNLVAKEAALVNERDGVLVLSENTGAHEELGEWAVTVNPFDIAGQALALDAALSMGAAERRERLGAIKAHVREHDLDAWIAAQLADLDGVSATARSL